MKQTGPIFIYSKSKPLEIKSGMFDVYLYGTPTLMKNPKGPDNWIKEIIKHLNLNNLSLEVPLVAELKNTSGLFSLILRTGNEFILASDIIRSYPVFYGFHQNRLFVTDHLEEFQKENGPIEIDNDKLEEFFASGLVYGNRTVYKNVYGLQAGEIVSIRSNDISSERYFKFKPAKKPVYYENLTEFTKDFDKIFLSAFSRMIEQTPHVNRWVIPLSGGHDSRLVVNYLHRLGVKNVICFSYGTPDNEQSRVSKQVADAIGYEWHFVEYTEQKWQALRDSGLFDEYLTFAFNGVSTPHLQDFLAVYELRAKGKIGDGDIFLPGHTVVTVSVFNEDTLKLKTEEEALQYVYSKIRRMTDLSRALPPIYIALQNMYFESKTSPENFMAFCDWQERQAKFITNSIKTYDFFGFESRQPMWDKEIVDFWLRIPAKERVGREPLFETEKQGGLVEQLAQIPFVGDNLKSIRLSISSMVKKLVPAYVIAKLLRVTRRKVKLNEGLNQIYALKAKSVKELLSPIEDFPEQTLPYFRDYLHRFTYQMDSNDLTALYTIRKLLYRNKKL